MFKISFKNEMNFFARLLIVARKLNPKKSMVLSGLIFACTLGKGVESPGPGPAPGGDLCTARVLARAFPGLLLPKESLSPAAKKAAGSTIRARGDPPMAASNQYHSARVYASASIWSTSAKKEKSCGRKQYGPPFACGESVGRQEGRWSCTT